MNHLVLKEAKKLNRASDLLYYRRLNWQVFVRDKIHRYFTRAQQEALTSDYPFSVNVHLFNQASEDTIQIETESNKTGGAGIATLEGKSALVASQAITGNISFIIYPRKSDRIQPLFKEILLYQPLDPADITQSKIQSAIEKFFFLSRVTSLQGYSSISFFDRVKLNWLLIKDLRYKTKLLKSILSMHNKWSNAILTAILALLAALYIKSQ